MLTPKADVLETSLGKFGVLCWGDLDAKNAAPVFVFIHGAGLTGWSFHRLANAVIDVSRTDKAGAASVVRCMALDLRCHGRSTDAGGAGSLSMETLVADAREGIYAGLKAFFPALKGNIYIVGHSLGGAIVANMMLLHKELPFKPTACVVLDVVEGTAKASLRGMKAFLDRRPIAFATEEAAVKWFVTHGGMHSDEAAAISVPPQLTDNGAADPAKRFTWRTDLYATEPQWDGWFEGFDKKFISIVCPKVLCLATVDRLDKDLTIAQMQGKFQFEVVGHGTGHYAHEDEPLMVAEKLIRLVRRMEVFENKLAALNKH